ncbi:MAG: serine/threonine protein kinase [Dehalococcoidia bacterium]|uniref:serine/threonine-protein kinase n=1 Tax=Candidatus Amarobacter glycogenicus TaxID=3140699 RepID=UPI00313616B8|nr:serine/threonine protein kinase [Dehalococcoidia bacterium]
MGRKPEATTATSSPRRESATPGDVAFSVGDSIGGEFEILGVHRGGMGAVYVVSHRELDSPIVLKAPLGADDPNVSALFRREAETWIAVGSHPNLVHAFWVRELQGRMFVAAEFVPPDELGRNSVADHVSHGPVPAPVSLKWTAQSCFGMSHAADHGMVAHRDIKTAHLMITVDGDLKITDFRVAKATEVEAFVLPTGRRSLSELTVSGAGTVPYMAPEQIQGRGELDSRADIYSFGASLYEMCTGKIPFQADSPSDCQDAPLGTAADDGNGSGSANRKVPR